MENNYIAAVDLGTTKVVIAVARRSEKNKVEIVSVKESASKGVIKGDLRNNELAYSSLIEAKAKIEEELGLSINEVYIGISGKHIKCNRATGYVFVHNSDSPISEVNAADVKRLTDDMYNSALPPGQTMITVLPQTYKIDDEEGITEPVGMEGRRLEAQFNLIVGEDAAIERIRRCFTRAGMTIADIELQPLASSYAVLSEDEKELGVAVVDIGGGTTDLCIYHDKIIRHIAVLPIGGDVVNDDIKAYGILGRHVEKLKTMFGEAVAERAADQKFITIPSVSGSAPKEIAVRTLADIIEARMCDIIEFVAGQIEKSGYKGKLGAGIVLTGGGSTLKNIDLLFRNKLGAEVRVASPSQYLEAETIEKINSPKYSTIAGILINVIRKMPALRAEPKLTPEQEAAIAMERQRQAYQAGLAAEGAQYNPPYNEPAAPGEHVADNSDTYVTPDDGQYYDDLDQNQDSDIQVIDRPKHKRPGIFSRMKKAMGGMFDEEIDADDNY